MEEKRSSIRRRALKSGKIIAGRGGLVVDCVLRDISGTGTSLLVEDIFEVPDRFSLQVEAPTGERRWNCRVVRRASCEVAVLFE
jgi:hypothetical protein